MHFDGEGVNLKETLEKKTKQIKQIQITSKKVQEGVNLKEKLKKTKQIKQIKITSKKSSRRCQPEGEAQKNQTNPTKKSHKSNKSKSQAKKEGVNLKEKLNNSWVTSPARSHKGCRSPWTIPEISKLEKFK